jgi:hypothetical protein
VSDKEEAERRISITAGLLNDLIEHMHECPFEDELSRVGALMGMMQKFETGHYALMAAVAIERLSRVIEKPNAVIEDIEGGENFFVELSASLIMTPKWARDSDRPAKIRAVARAVHAECSKSQLALLTAIGMVRLTETGSGPIALEEL